MSGAFFTIGMAGHIDHGKTTLTKALTNIDTDRLKEEKLRSISIEPGFAPIDLGDGNRVSIIDVPGHERFIRQMIAGVAGIDLVILVVAADEGVMPQTREHAEILGYLGIEHALIAVTKMNKVEDEMLDLVQDDIKTELEGTIFEDVSTYFVDGLSHAGIGELKEGIRQSLPVAMKRNPHLPLRMPIDQAFTLHGKGTIVRGTVFEGKVHSGDQLRVLPLQKEVRVRQLQVHKQNVDQAYAGQRAAINISGVSANELKRGDVLTTNTTISAKTVLDLVLYVHDKPDYEVKQRARMKLHTGTSEIMGTLVFFDRNELTEKDHQMILCQIRLDDPVAVLRGDRFIIRRPSPVETIGGGWILDSDAGKYKFGEETIKMLRAKQEGTPEKRIIMTLQKFKAATNEELAKALGESSSKLKQHMEELHTKSEIIFLNDHSITLTSVFENVCHIVQNRLSDYHERYPMRVGMPKAELIQELKSSFPTDLLEFAIGKQIEGQHLLKKGSYLSAETHTPSFPEKWKKRLDNVVLQLKDSGFKHEGLKSMYEQQRVPDSFYEEFERYLIETRKAIRLEDGTYVHSDVFIQAVKTLYESTSEHPFNVQDAKGTLELSRKYCILFLEQLDDMGLTVRKEDDRKWVSHQVATYIT